MDGVINDFILPDNVIFQTITRTNPNRNSPSSRSPGGNTPNKNNSPGGGNDNKAAGSSPGSNNEDTDDGTPSRYTNTYTWGYWLQTATTTALETELVKAGEPYFPKQDFVYPHLKKIANGTDSYCYLHYPVYLVRDTNRTSSNNMKSSSQDGSGRHGNNGNNENSSSNNNGNNSSSSGSSSTPKNHQHDGSNNGSNNMMSTPEALNFTGCELYGEESRVGDVLYREIGERMD